MHRRHAALVVLPLLGACLSAPDSESDFAFADGPQLQEAEPFRGLGHVDLATAPVGGEALEVDVGELSAGETVVFDLVCDDKQPWQGTVSVVSSEWFDPDEPWDCPPDEVLCLPPLVDTVTHPIDLYLSPWRMGGELISLEQIPRKCRSDGCDLADYAPKAAYLDTSAAGKALEVELDGAAERVRLVISVVDDAASGVVIIAPGDIGASGSR